MPPHDEINVQPDDCPEQPETPSNEHRAPVQPWKEWFAEELKERADDENPRPDPPAPPGIGG